MRDLHVTCDENPNDLFEFEVSTNEVMVTSAGSCRTINIPPSKARRLAAWLTAAADSIEGVTKHPAGPEVI